MSDEQVEQTTTDEDTQGHHLRAGVVPVDDDVDGHSLRIGAAPEVDTAGHNFRGFVVPSEDDEDEDTEGHAHH